MPFAAFLACCCQGAEASMPVAETKAPILTQTLGGQAGQSGGTEERAWVQENGGLQGQGLVHFGGSLGRQPWATVTHWHEWHALREAQRSSLVCVVTGVSAQKRDGKR